MPKYRVLQQSFLNNGLVQEGDIVEYDGDVHDNLELIEDESKPTGKGGKSKGSAGESQEQAGE